MAGRCPADRCHGRACGALSGFPARLVGVSARKASGAGVAISLFSGAGGLDLGIEDAGYEVRVAVERDRDAAITMEKNFPGLASPVIQADILDVPTSDILHAAGLRGSARPDLLVGGPPCTPFSKSGFWLEWKRAGLDPSASLLQACTRVLAEARPRRFVLENVYALTFDNRASRPAYERLLREIDPAGYHGRASVLNAADYGVPQARPRLFIVGAPKDVPLPGHPAPTHGGLWERRVNSGPPPPPPPPPPTPPPLPPPPPHPHQNPPGHTPSAPPSHPSAPPPPPPPPAPPPATRPRSRATSLRSAAPSPSPSTSSSASAWQGS